MNTVLFSVQEGRRQISCILSPFSFRTLVTDYNANTRARSRERTRDRRDRRTLMHNWTQHGDIYRLPGWPRHMAGKMLLLVSNMQLSLFCHLFGLIQSLLDCLRCTNIEHRVRTFDLSFLFFPRNYKDVTTLHVLTWQIFPRTTTQNNRLSHALEGSPLKFPAGWAAWPHLPRPGHCQRATWHVQIFQAALMEPGTVYVCHKTQGWVNPNSGDEAQPGVCIYH